MKANVWSTPFNLKNGKSSYLDERNVDVPDTLKMCDIIYIGKFKCKITDIYILFGRFTIRVEVID